MIGGAQNVPTAEDADLYLVGLGLKPSHVTVETRTVLGRVNRILYASYVPATAEFLRELCPDIVDTSEFYVHGSDRLRTYKTMAARALEAALEMPPVALALYGHPLLLSLPSAICLRAGPRLGVRVRTLPGISALDCLMADLGIDIVGTGVQMHEATDILLYRRTLQPELAAVVWQVGLLGTRLHSADTGNTPDRIRELGEYLSRWYTADHPATLVVSAITDEPSRLYHSTVGQLGEVGELLTPATTLYLPPIPAPERVDRDIAARLTNPDYLDAVTLPTGNP
ncbi:SAM-dependent methyltransferase [Nocardia beijingensis]|uniref:SAM-dependent methyltransferase n=1 Tax=Nocardia beijingensis TaxID=95162 RepID=UPI0033C8BB8A